MEEIGGWRGIAVLLIGMFVFVHVVEWTVSRRHARKAARRLNAERQRKSR